MSTPDSSAVPPARKVILGSRSPQRLQLLRQIIPDERIQVLPSADPDEDNFDGLTTREVILLRLTSIARTKCKTVRDQIGSYPYACLLTADTTVIVGKESELQVLGKPDGPDWEATVRNWFKTFYSARTHEVVTACCCQFADGSLSEFHSSTTLKFKPVNDELLNWYIATQEPLGKAGGYGIQSAGSLFVESISGSLSNVIGLPMEEVWEQFQRNQIV